MLFDASLPSPDEDDFGYIERPAYGLDDVSAGSVPSLPYPINIYQVGGDSASGIAGTLYPNGTFVPLPITPAPQPTSWWEERVADFVDGTATWNGHCGGGVQVGAPGEPNRRIYDGTLLGDWPLNPPRAERTVNPEKARLAAAIRAMEEGEDIE